MPRRLVMGDIRNAMVSVNWIQQATIDESTKSRLKLGVTIQTLILKNERR
jgi:hypothetical protein